MKKEDAVKMLNAIIKKAEDETDGYNYLPYVSSPAKRNEAGEEIESKTCLKIIETRDDSIHHVEYRFGHIDNLTGEYVAAENDLTKVSSLAEAQCDEFTAKRETTPEQEQKELERNIHNKIYTEILERYADKIAAEMGCDFKISDNLYFWCLHNIATEVADDEEIKNRVTEIIKRDIEDFVERWVKPREAE